YFGAIRYHEYYNLDQYNDKNNYNIDDDTLQIITNFADFFANAFE
ncbi:unnamed protein product, partial [Oikopleura dioica]